MGIGAGAHQGGGEEQDCLEQIDQRRLVGTICETPIS